jgi:serine protease inhibitor
VTVGQIRLTSARPVVGTKIMKVDRPFVFMISDMENKNILFAGKIVNL